MLKAFSRFFLFAFLSILILSFQNCSPSVLNSAPFASSFLKEGGGGNGEPYDGKPEGYTRLIPGQTCADQTVAYGSLRIVGDFATVISNQNHCSNVSEQVPVKNLEFSSFSNLYIGYKGGVYTYLKDRNENIAKEIFTEAWCKALKPNSTESLAEFVVEWQAAGKMARFAILNQKDAAPQFVSVERQIDLDRVSYKTTDNNLLSINFRQRSPASLKVSGKYLGSLNGQASELTVDCLMGGQFDPTAPQFDFSDSGSPDQMLAVGETMTPLVPEVNIATTTFKISDPLPKGISFDASTGIISGSPLELAAQKEFWVTAQFAFGEVTRRLSLGVGQVQLVDQEVVNSSAVACTNPVKNCDLAGALAKSKLITPIPLIVRLQVPNIDFKGQELVVSDYISIVGLPSKTTLDAHSLSRHFSVISSNSQLSNTSTFAHLELNNLNLINGKASMGGSIYTKYGSVSIQKSSFVNNTAYSGDFVGGGALGMMMSTLNISDSEFIGNQSPDSNFGSGGAIDMMWPFWGTIKNTNFKNNSTFNSGGAVNITHKTFSPIEFTNCLFESNSASGMGGAVSSSEVDLFISKSRFLSNTAGEAAAVSASMAKRVWILDSQLTENKSKSSILRFSGITWNSGPEIGTSIAYIMNSQLLGNETLKGAGAVLQGANMNIILSNSNFDSYGKSTECMSNQLQSLGGVTSSDGTCSGLK